MHGAATLHACHPVTKNVLIAIALWRVDGTYGVFLESWTLHNFQYLSHALYSDTLVVRMRKEVRVHEKRFLRIGRLQRDAALRFVIENEDSDNH